MATATSRLANPAADPRHVHKVVALFVLIGAYFALNMVGRWFRGFLFSAYGRNGWPEPTFLTTAYQVFMACVSIVFLTWVSYLIVRRFPRLCNRAVVILVTFVLAAAVELDVNWLIMSRNHITLDDVKLFLAGSWSDDFGIEGAEIVHVIKMIARHALFLTGLWLVSLLLGNFLFKTNFLARTRLTWKKVGVVVTLLFVADGAWVGYLSRHDSRDYNPSQWQFLASANPTRIGPVDRFWYELFRTQGDLATANQVLLADAKSPEASSVSHEPAASAKPYNVVVIAVESLNARLFGQTDLAFWKELSSRSLQLRRHYTTGNCTHYGVLGLLFGSPPLFYNGAIGQDRSPFLDLFAERGYRSKRITAPLVSFRSMGNYLPNFTEAAFECKDEWSLIPQVRSALDAPGPHFLFLFYNKTHYHYAHAPEYNRYQPEVAPDFHFQRWDAARYYDQITNRYKNCLLEFDAWLKALVKEIDLERTILVVTGDHGEEFFESGRLGHCSYLNDAQTRVPCLIAIPGRKASVQEGVTSHADIMPTVIEALGWKTQVPCYGHSVLHPYVAGTAVVAHNNQANRPRVWAVISKDRKAILEGHRDLEIIALMDQSDHPLPFSQRPDDWNSNFAEVRRFQQALLSAIRGNRPAATQPMANRKP